MKLCKKIFGIATLAFIILMLVSSTVLATHSYYATVQVQETGGDPYDYLPIIADIDNDYLADNGYISLTGLDTKILSGSTPLEHLVADDKVLFVIPSVGANSTGNYRYTLGNDPQEDFPIITGVDGYITIDDDDTLDGGGGMDDFELEWKGCVDTDAGSFKDLLFKPNAFRAYIQAEDAIRATILDTAVAYPTVAATNGGDTVTDGNAVNLPAGIVPDDLLLVFFAADEDPTITFPTGWTQLFHKKYSAYVTLGAWYRIADGTEGSTIIATLSSSEQTAHTSYRITGYYGVPEVGTSVTGSDDEPDPPSLTPWWGSAATLWLVVAAYDDGRETINDPTNYTNPLNNRSDAAAGVGVGSARRERTAASEDPGVFTISGATEWIANTIAIQPAPLEDIVVTVTGITSGERIITASANGTHLILSVTDYDGVPLGNSPQDIGLAAATVPDNANDWLLDLNNVMPYMEYYQHTVADTLIAWYQPVSMIIGTTLDDREGTDAGETGTAEEDSTITWGENPADLSATIGSLISSDQPEVTPASEEGAIDIVPEGEIPEGGVVNVTKLENNPLYPIVQIVSEYTDYTDEQIWFIGATIIILIGMGISAVKVPSHLLLAGTVGLVLAGFFTAMEIYQWWMMLVTGFIFVMTLVMERKPVL